MSQVIPPAASSAPGSEKKASSATLPASAPPLSAKKVRSCVVCRSRKVRCDKQSPCSNCRRAGIPCVLPSTDRPPRWARRHANSAGSVSNSQAPQDVTKVMDRLLSLENLVKELSGQLEQAHATQYRDTEHQRESTPPAASTSAASSVQSNFGRLVLRDAKQSHYVSSGFWSRVNDEVRSRHFEVAVVLTRRLADFRRS
jgi:Zn(2)-Cys(6) binuclear cluster domain-containing protein